MTMIWRDRLAVHVRHAGDMLPVVIALAIAVSMAAAIASTYVGSSRSPYDTCFGPNERAVPCAWIGKRR